MNIYKQNITQSKYTRLREIDVFIFYRNEDETYENDDVGWTTSYDRRHFRTMSNVNSIIAPQDFFQKFEPYLYNSEPTKLCKWNILMDSSDVGDISSYFDRDGNLLNSYEDIVRSMPECALDTTVTVQTTEKSFMEDTEGCIICRECSGNDKQELKHGDKEGIQPAGPRYTNAEIFRHRMHIADAKLTVVPDMINDDHNQFFGQENQMTTEMKLGEALNANDTAESSSMIMVAQVSIFSNRGDSSNDSNKACVRVSNDGHVLLDENNTNNSPLSMLLPWVRLPSFLLTEHKNIEIREINLWACARECKTNTHYDGHHNLLMVLCGTKTIELSPPDSYRGSPIHSDHANHPYLLRCEQVGGHLVNDNFLEDTSQYKPPKAKDNNLVVAIKAGSAIFIPEGWWHRVESSSKCIAINVWFDHKGSSISSMCNETNRHLLTYQAREMVRQFIDFNIDKLNRDRISMAYVELLSRCGLDTSSWNNHQCEPVKEFLGYMTVNLRPDEKTPKQVENGIQVIEKYATKVLSIPMNPDHPNSSIPSLQQIALSDAIYTVAIMISFFILILDPIESNAGSSKQKCAEDRRAITILFKRLSALVTTETKCTIFTQIVQSLTSAAYYKLSLILEYHMTATDAQELFTSIFGACAGDEGIRFFLARVDDFRNESAERLILGDLMLLNPKRRDKK